MQIYESICNRNGELFYRPKKKKINNINWETDMTRTSFIAFTIMYYQTIIQVPKMYFMPFMIILNYTVKLTNT